MVSTSNIPPATRGTRWLRRRRRKTRYFLRKNFGVTSIYYSEACTDVLRKVVCPGPLLIRGGVEMGYSAPYLRVWPQASCPHPWWPSRHSVHPLLRAQVQRLAAYAGTSSSSWTTDRGEWSITDFSYRVRSMEFYYIKFERFCEEV